MVVAPTSLSDQSHSGVAPRTGLSFASRKTPAFTMVELWR